MKKTKRKGKRQQKKNEKILERPIVTFYLFLAKMLSCEGCNFFFPNLITY